MKITPRLQLAINDVIGCLLTLAGCMMTVAHATRTSDWIWALVFLGACAGFVQRGYQRLKTPSTTKI
jgi:hypothetical protein